MLDRPGAIEDEIGLLISEIATARARDLFAAGEQAPAGNDLYSRAVRGVHERLVCRKKALDAAERMRQYEETDLLLKRIRAGEDVEI